MPTYWRASPVPHLQEQANVQELLSNQVSEIAQLLDHPNLLSSQVEREPPHSLEACISMGSAQSKLSCYRPATSQFPLGRRDDTDQSRA